MEDRRKLEYTLKLSVEDEDITVLSNKLDDINNKLIEIEERYKRINNLCSCKEE